MRDIYLTNSLSRKKEKFEPLNPSNIGIYTCGPTVYDRAHIGNFRTYTTSDIVVRTLRSNGFNVKYVMNITDVGHLVSDADEGEDKMEKAVKREGKNAWEIAKFYTQEFVKDMELLNLIKPDNLVKATEHIEEQIFLIKKLEAKGFTYKTSDGIYFNTQKYEELTGKKYGELSTIDEVKEGARVEKNPEKKNSTDFALWKFSEKPGDRDMEWESPWGIGFPGWHIECSAMSMKYLGESFDIHIGGEDLKPTHHPNEIAQSEAVTDKQFVKYWMHATFLQIDSSKMAKSKGNAYNIKDVIDRGFEPLALRYLYLTAHYRDALNFTWESLRSANKTLSNLRKQMSSLRNQKTRTILSEEKRKKVEDFGKKFLEAVNDDFNTPRAVAVLWEVLKSNIPSEDKYDLAITFDEILGVGLAYLPTIETKEIILPNSGLQVIVVGEVPEKVVNLIDKREMARNSKDYSKADALREKIVQKGFELIDSQAELIIRPKDL